MGGTLLVPDPELREMRRGVRKGGGPLCEVLSEVLVHLEHGHAVFTEHGLELLVSLDLALVLRVLEVVLLDVVPNLAHHLSAGQRLGAHHGSRSAALTVSQRSALLSAMSCRSRAVSLSMHPSASCGGATGRASTCMVPCQTTVTSWT